MSSSMPILTSDILLDDGKMMRNVLLFNNEIKEFDPMIAYLDGDYYYLYRGDLPNAVSGDHLDPGIYYDKQSDKYVLAVPTTDEEKQQYTYSDKICSTTASEIVDKINKKEVEVFVMPESSKAFCPEISENDDILKRLMKQAIINKGIDIDRFKYRFVDKNALFNFKQVLKGDNRLSMLLFDRGAEAFNLKYTIVLEEDLGDSIGIPLSEPIVVSSNDTHELNSKTMKFEDKDSE